jgi:hypothetical protein
MMMGLDDDSVSLQEGRVKNAKDNAGSSRGEVHVFKFWMGWGQCLGQPVSGRREGVTQASTMQTCGNNKVIQMKNYRWAWAKKKQTIADEAEGLSSSLHERCSQTQVALTLKSSGLR